ncbi:MAG: BNR/Asp-box repeat domain protein [Labilithrix sp.]|nr:BNR/Asp-box repeat domain protein [Labilithrix sp.]
MKSLLGGAVASALVLGWLAPGTALANGRFPETNALFFAPSDPDFVLLRTTFGEMISHDRGKTFGWVCEQSVGLAGIEDPMYAITPDDTIVGSTYQGLAVSRDRGCSFAFVGGGLELVFVDVASTRRAPGTVVAFASSYAGTDGGTTVYKSQLFETTDQGKTFAPLPYAFPSNVLGETVDVTESDPDRIYVSAIEADAAGNFGHAAIFTSRDHGTTFEELPFPLAGDETAPFIAAVDPRNADRLYVRTAAPAGKKTRLLVSDDAGKTFHTVYDGAGALQGFAVSDDGTRIWVGGPADGLRTALASDLAVTKISDVEIGCLKSTSEGLWACSTERSGFILGLSTDGGGTFAPRLHFCDITGPLACPAGSSTYQMCSLGNATMNVPPWPGQRASLGCSDVPDGGSSSGAVDAGALPDAPSAEDDGGCALRAPSRSGGVAGALGAMAMIALAALRRRKR